MGSEAQRRSVSDGGIRVQDVRAQLARITSSRVFVNSDRMTRFLSFTSEQALAGRSATLKEYLVGVEVFDRSPDFDPRVDPIVRVEARRLREKLRRYYATEGRLDAILIEYPKGSYAPHFRRRSSPAASELAAPAIAVLPFANLGSEPDNEYFSDGLTEELIHALTKVRGLHVVAWDTAARWKGRPVDLRAAREQLKVSTVLEGSVRSSGERLRITAQLIDTATGYYLWSEAYERRMSDVFAIQDEISRAIVNTLRVQLVGGESRPLVKPASDPETHNHYLRARYHMNKRTEDGLRASVRFLDQALEIDPGYALAWAALADSYSLLADYGISAPSVVMPKAKAAALKAIELDETLAEAHTALAFVLALYDWKWDEAEQHYQRAIDLNPGYSTAHHWYASDLLAPLGRFDEALEEVRKALQLDPLSLITGASLGFIFIEKGDYNAAREQFRGLLDLEPNFYKGHSGLGRLAIEEGRYNEAIELFEKAREISGNHSYLGQLGQAYALAGRRREALRLLEELSEIAQEKYVQACSTALIHVGLGDYDRAIDLLERSAEQREAPLVFLRVYPSYARLRRHPRFRQLLAKIGLE